MYIDPNRFNVEARIGESFKPIDNILDIDYTTETLKRDGDIVGHEIKCITIEYIDETGKLSAVSGSESMFRFTKVNRHIPRKDLR
jgi:hypothetical protein